MDEKTYKEYKKRIAEAQIKIDNSSPKFDVATYYKPRNLSIDANRIREIDRENMVMLRRINVITRLGGTVDCWMGNIKYESKFDDSHVKNMITKSNKILLKSIRNAVSKYSTAEFIRSWKDMKMLSLHSRKYKEEPTGKTAVSLINEDRCVVDDLKLLNQMNSSIRTRCFFEIEIQGDMQKLGIIHFELYDDIAPRTCANFAELCRGTTDGLSYKNTPFHRIVSGYWCQGGDVTKFNGSGGTSIYGDSFENENFHLRHAGPGILSMCSNNENSSDSKFNLTFRRLDTMNGKHVVFGKIISGFSNIYKIEEFGTKTGKPIQAIIISNCGVISRRHDHKGKKHRKNSAN